MTKNEAEVIARRKERHNRIPPTNVISALSNTIQTAAATNKENAVDGIYQRPHRIHRDAPLLDAVHRNDRAKSIRMLQRARYGINAVARDENALRSAELGDSKTEGIRSNNINDTGGGQITPGAGVAVRRQPHAPEEFPPDGSPCERIHCALKQ